MRGMASRTRTSEEDDPFGMRSAPTPPPASKLPLSRSLKHTRSAAHLISRPTLLSRSTAHYPFHAHAHAHLNHPPELDLGPEPGPELGLRLRLARANSSDTQQPIPRRQRSFSPAPAPAPALSQSLSARSTSNPISNPISISNPIPRAQTPLRTQTQLYRHPPGPGPAPRSLVPPQRPKPPPPAPLRSFHSAPSSSGSSESDYSRSSTQLPSPPSSASQHDSLRPSRPPPNPPPNDPRNPKARLKVNPIEEPMRTSPLRIIKKPAGIQPDKLSHQPLPPNHARSPTPVPAGSQSHPITVLVRIRNPIDPQSGRTKLLSYDQRTITLDMSAHSDSGPVQHTFTFDKVLGPSAGSQERLFQDTGVEERLLVAFLGGTNASLIAYGQTGAGKSYTMGTARGAEAGLVPRTLARLFGRLGPPGVWTLSGSFIEVYNDELVDLGAPGRPGSPFPGGAPGGIAIREARDGTITWVGARSVALHTLGDAMSLLSAGLQRRATGATGMNNASSRSHAILCLQLAISESEGVSRRSKFMFVDLAGSERVSRTGNVAGGERFKEGVSINAGLHALGNVICALSKSSTGGAPANHQGSQAGGTTYVPYRESKLTRLLQDSLGGNSKTMVIGCVSPDAVNVGESLSTLRYASRAKKIKNVTTRTTEVSRLKALEEENSRLRERLLRLERVDERVEGGSGSNAGAWVEEREEMLRGVVYEYEVSLGRLESEVEEVREALRQREIECDQLRSLLERER